MRMQVIFAHNGYLVDRSRQVFSQVISMALFLTFMSSRLRPPFSHGWWRVSSAIFRFMLSSHIKFQIILVSISSILGGIPCALVRNWVYLPNRSCVISFHPQRVSQTLLHLFSVLWVLSMMGFQGVSLFVLYSIQAPSDLIALLLWVIFILLSSWSSSLGLIILISITWDLWASELRGIFLIYLG